MDSIALHHLQSAGFRKFVPVLIDQGDTGAASRIHIRANDLAGIVAADHVGPLRVRVCNSGVFADSTNATIAAAAGSALLEALTANKDLILSEIRAAYAGGTLTLTGVVIDGEIVTLGDRVYQFRTGATALVSGRVAVDISARGTKAQGTLTIAEPLTAGDVIVIGDQAYVFVAGTANSPAEIGIGANEAATKLAIVAAINGTDDVNTANTKVTASAFSGDVCTLTARYTGTQGNSIVTAELGQGLTHASNVFNAATLGTTTAGVDPSAAHAITDLVSAITGDASAVVTAVDGAGDTVVVTAKTSGVAGNSIASTKTMANGSFGGAVLSGGVDAVAGTYGLDLTDATAETVTLRIGPAPQGGCFGDFSTSLDVVHAAP